MKYYICKCVAAELCPANWDEKFPDTCPFLLEVDTPDFWTEEDE